MLHAGTGCICLNSCSIQARVKLLTVLKTYLQPSAVPVALPCTPPESQQTHVLVTYSQPKQMDWLYVVDPKHMDWLRIVIPGRIQCCKAVIAVPHGCSALTSV